MEAGKKTKPEPKAPKLKRPNLNFNAIFKKPNKNAKTDTTAELPHGQEANRDSSEETVVITDEIPEKKVSYWTEVESYIPLDICKMSGKATEN